METKGRRYAALDLCTYLVYVRYGNGLSDDMLFRFGLDYLDVYQIILGYIVITSFYKSKNNVNFD